jgi:hypothetical protein
VSGLFLSTFVQEAAIGVTTASRFVRSRNTAGSGDHPWSGGTTSGMGILPGVVGAGVALPRLTARRAATIEPTIEKPSSKSTPSENRPPSNSTVLASIRTLSASDGLSDKLARVTTVHRLTWRRILSLPPLRAHPACIRRGRDEAALHWRIYYEACLRIPPSALSKRRPSS